ncbi:MAG: hypothetical protein NTW21_06800 [Verrucomicrobia bacterium]|nr:hypothetical protein [Verrucomicrobiota bacterium]
MITRTPDLEARPVAADLSCIARQFAAIPHLSLRRHDGNVLREEIQLPLTGRQQAGFGGAQWLCTTRVRAVAGRLGTFDLEVTFAVTAGHAAEVGTAVGITCGEWSRNNHGIPQYMSRADRPLNQIMQPGWICERVNLSDWEGTGAVGGNHFGSTWPEVSLMLTTIEIPGLYVQPDTGFFHAFDHVEVTRIRHAEGRLALKLSNPTGFDATIKVLCESSAGRCLPLKLNALFGVRQFRVPAGESVVAEFISQF